MRNINKYPITHQEVLDNLQNIWTDTINKIQKGGEIGGTTAMSLTMARAFIEAYEPLFVQYVSMFELGGNKLDQSSPYLTELTIQSNKKYNPDYGDDKICTCGHHYYRHFDTYEEEMETAGCKYCDCYEFKEKSQKVIDKSNTDM